MVARRIFDSYNLMPDSPVRLERLESYETSVPCVMAS